MNNKSKYYLILLLILMIIAIIVFIFRSFGYGIMCTENPKWLGDPTGGYFQKCGEIYNDYHSPYLPAPKIKHPKSFKIISTYYGQDKNFVYYRGQEIKNADINSFIALNDFYSKDKKHVFFEEKILNGADTISFYSIGLETAKDKMNIWHLDQVVENADLATYRIFEKREDFAVDKNYVFYKGFKIEESDPKTFRPYDKENNEPLYFVDKEYVYTVYLGRLKNIDPKSFKPIGYDYFRDKNGIYYKDTLIDKVDTNSFIVQDRYSAIDKNNTYCRERSILIDPVEYKSLSTNKKRGYCYN